MRKKRKKRNSLLNPLARDYNTLFSFSRLRKTVIHYDYGRDILEGSAIFFIDGQRGVSR